MDSELLECEAAPCLETDEAWTGLDNGLDLDDSTSPGSDLARSRSLQNLSQVLFIYYLLYRVDNFQTKSMHF